MKNKNHLLMFVVLLMIFVLGTGFLLNQYRLYKRAYQELGRAISHLSIDPEYFSEEEGYE